jgi:putative MATE family efflux protein
MSAHAQSIATLERGNVIDPRTRRLLEDPLIGVLIRLVIPNVLVMVTQAGVALLEVYFVAKLGVDALAGVSQVFPILSLIGALSQGSVGGGVVSAIARSLGRGQRREAGEFVWYVVAIAVPLGLLTSVIVLALGPLFYTAMGAEGPSLAAALQYSNLVFGGAVLIWLFNLLIATVRGTGNLILPVIVVCGGAVVLIPLSPALIFGLGPLPGLGVSGGAAAILAYYATGSAILIWYLWGRRGVLRPPARPPRLRFRRAWDILRVGGMSALVSGSTNITIAVITGFVGLHSIAAVAGYGAGARLEFILVPLSYGIGGPTSILIGTNIGAGNAERARRTAWIGTLGAVAVAELIGLAAASHPGLWIGAFSDDPTVLVTGAAYLHAVGPFFGFFGAGYALYCVGQGTGRMEWPVAGALVRMAIAVVGGFLVVRFGGGLAAIFLAVGIGMAAFGLLSLPGLLSEAAFRGRRAG